MTGQSSDKAEAAQELRRFIGEDMARVRDACAMVKADMEADVRRFDGEALSGRVVAQMHGQLAAAISALAGMVDHITRAVDDLAAKSAWPSDV